MKDVKFCFFFFYFFFCPQSLRVDSVMLALLPLRVKQQCNSINFLCLSN